MFPQEYAKVQLLYNLCYLFFKIIVILMEKAMAPDSSTLAWRIPGMVEPGGLLSMG